MDFSLLNGPFSCYLPAQDYDAYVEHEIGGADLRHGRILIKSGEPKTSFWSQNLWSNAVSAPYRSIGDAASVLRSIQRNWAACPQVLHRRHALIKDKLPPISEKPRPFPFDPPAQAMGSYTLLDEGRLIYCPSCTSPYPNGRIDFIEDKINPPSRAYLKLYEALSLSRNRPQAGQLCLDAGACPGGWTWVLLGLGAQVLAIDRSELRQDLMSRPGLRFLRHSAFTLKPQELGKVDWLFSDVICYPSKLLEWIRAWLESGLCRRFICTLKMQGQADWESIAAFAAIPGSRIVHLYNNKHELTWFLDQG